jgi:hypothetical protein
MKRPGLPADPPGFATILEMLRYAFPACSVVARAADRGQQLRVWLAHRTEAAGAAVTLAGTNADDDHLRLDYAERKIAEIARDRPWLGGIDLARA